MIDTRLLKAIRDLRLDPVRTLIVVLAIAIGMFTIGTVAVGYSVLDREMNYSYMHTNPASAIIGVDRVNDSLINDVKSVSTVSGVEPRRVVYERLQVGPDKWRTIQLFVIDDFENIHISKVYHERGSWPPGENEILIERAALPLTGANIGDMVTVKTLKGTEKELRVVGTVYDPGHAPAPMEDTVYGYITNDTLADLGETPYLNQLLITVAQNGSNEAHVWDTAYQLKDHIEQSGHKVSSIDVPPPGKHPRADQMNSLLFLFEAFGVLSFILSLILVVNMVNGLLAQQVRQIGMMKAVGATTGQVMAIYLGVVFILGVLATAIAVPASIVVGRALAAKVAVMLNLDITSYAIPAWVFALLSFLGLLMPIASAAYPVYMGSRITIHNAINDYGMGSTEKYGMGIFSSLIGRIPGLSRPLMLSIRNTFRRRGRLALTLLTLAIGGMLFLVSMNISSSIDTTADNVFGSWHYNTVITFAKPYPIEDIRQNISKVPGTAQVECWGTGYASFVHSDGKEENKFSIVALPATTRIFNPMVTSGRWLKTGDENSVVLNHVLVDMLREHDHYTVKVGDSITLDINGNKSTWRVAGIVRERMAPATAYVDYGYYSRLTGQEGLAQKAIVVTDSNISASEDITPSLERDLNDTGMKVQTVISRSELRQLIKQYLLVITSFLIIMSMLTVTVGCLGLASTMNINIIERRREIGVMRAIGASGRTIFWMIVVEALVVGMLSWLLAMVLAPPVSIIIGNIFGMIIFKTPLDISFSLMGMVLWLAIITILSPVASLLSAWKASRMPVHEVLAYE